MARLNDDEIKREIDRDLALLDDNGIEKLAEFYQKIVIEPTISIKSFRYYYAKAALIIISEFRNDEETIKNLKAFHSAKIAEEMVKPTVTLADEDYSEPKLAKNRATIQQRRAIPNAKETVQAKF